MKLNKFKAVSLLIALVFMFAPIKFVSGMTIATIIIIINIFLDVFI